MPLDPATITCPPVRCMLNRRRTRFAPQIATISDPRRAPDRVGSGLARASRYKSGSTRAILNAQTQLSNTKGSAG